MSSDSFGLCGREVHCLQKMAFLFVPICVTCVPVLSLLPRWFSGSSGASPGPHAKRATFCRVVCLLLVACFGTLSGRCVPSQVILYMFTCAKGHVKLAIVTVFMLRSTKHIDSPVQPSPVCTQYSRTWLVAKYIHPAKRTLCTH